MQTLQALRDALAALSGVTTCRIGLEANMTPAAYPMVRIVPSVLRDAEVINRRQVEMLIYFGQPLHEFNAGMQNLYGQLLTMEAALLTGARTAADVVFGYIESVLDEPHRRLLADGDPRGGGRVASYIQAACFTGAGDN